MPIVFWSLTNSTLATPPECLTCHDPVSHLKSVHPLANSNDRTCPFVGRGYWQRAIQMSVDVLQIRMTQRCRCHFDQELVRTK